MSEAKSEGDGGGREGATRGESEGVGEGREERADEPTPKRTEGGATERGAPPSRDEGAGEHYASHTGQDFTNVKLRWWELWLVRQNYHGIT